MCSDTLTHDTHNFPRDYLCKYLQNYLLKIFAGTFCVSTLVPIEAPHASISDYSQRTQLVHAIAIVDCSSSKPPRVTKH